MSTDQNSTRDRSRDQVRISGGPGAPGENTAVTEPSAQRVDDLGTEARHAPTDPGTDGTHTATEPHAGGTHSSTGSAHDPADDTADRAHDKSHTVATEDAATADGLSGKPTITAGPTDSGTAATTHDTTQAHDAEPHSATVSREPAVPATTATTPESADTDRPLFDRDLLDVLETRWKEVQGSFVDNPHDAVTRADLLVAETLEQITARWTEHQQQLQGRWSRGTDSDTENLRQALRDYRTFFQKLLTLGN
ncbi:hypothetical protein [Nocardia sp. NPDC057353]|uniref:hypothetical protein n=1 Tax=Nocardia sp. NPDC057353 TaxID=3346104 RepID=UPI00362C9970